MGLVRAGEASTRELDQTEIVGESLWMDVDGADGAVHMLDAGLNWQLEAENDVQVSLEGGVRALAQAGPQTDGFGSTPAAEFDTGLLTVPVMGAAVRWSMTHWAYVEGRATGNVADVLGRYVDLTAEAGVELTPQTGLVAGYRYLDASFDSSGAAATLSQDALYAGLRIRY